MLLLNKGTCGIYKQNKYAFSKKKKQQKTRYAQDTYNLKFNHNVK